MKELAFDELTTRQKLGMVFTPILNSWVKSEEDEEFVLDLIKNCSLGSVWIQQGARDDKEMLAKVKKIADYPILIMTDAESGMKPYLVGRHSAIGCTGSLEHAYAFGKVSGGIAHDMGYNMLCNPIVDIKPGLIRSLGGDKEKVAQMAVAIAKGMHDSGVMTIAKHYPGGSNPLDIDTHMTEGLCYETADELKAESLYPYQKMMEQDLLDGLMVGHKKYPNIDPNRPASLSKPVIDVIRNMGFNGFIITDALCMFGIRANYSYEEAQAYAVAAGVDGLLPFVKENKARFEELCSAYEKGMIPDDMLNAAVKRVLTAQHKAFTMSSRETTQQEWDLFNRIDKDAVYEKVDEGVSKSISRDGSHFFALMINNDAQYTKEGVIDVDTFSSSWYSMEQIEGKIKELFPNAKFRYIYEYPRQWQNNRILEESKDCDELIFLTYSEPLSYCGPEAITQRFMNLMRAMQHTGRISTVLHLGNPRVLEEAPHIPRMIFGGLAKNSIDACFEVLAGNYPAKGTLTCEVNLK